MQTRPETLAIVATAGQRGDSPTRYDRLAVRYEATLHVAAITEWLRPLTS
jgi:hypothetical protein